MSTDNGDKSLTVLDFPKLFWPIDKLHNWDKNPRAIKKDDFERLKKQIKEL
uniref:Uncharacterized protein n=1 Tax=viral metagenome TaxID=1070528 RepID=A0A6M3ISR8_9ZZZZ